MTTYVLVPGMWIGAWAWRDVAAALRARGHEVHPLTLTGVADRAHLLGPDTDLDLHTEDVVRLIEAEDLRDVVLAGHSYGGMPVSAAALRLRDRIRHVVYVDSGPLPVGTSQLAVAGGEAPGDAVPPREWDAGKDPVLLAGLSDEALDRLRRLGTPHPAASVRQPIGARATSEDLPTTLIACTFPPEQVREMTAAGHPFFAGLTRADVVSLPTGHWPMLSEPEALAGHLEQIG